MMVKVYTIDGNAHMYSGNIKTEVVKGYLRVFKKCDKYYYTLVAEYARDMWTGWTRDD